MSKEPHRKDNLFRYWWISLIVGILGIAAGICCFVIPAGSLAVMTTFFIAILIVGGIFNITWALANRNWNDSWGWSLARGILEILFGLWLIMLPLPLVTAMLIYLVGIWMLFHSILGICESCTLSEFRIPGWGWLLACNILSLICSFVFLAAPAYGGIFVLAYVGISFLLYGIFRIAVSFEWRTINRKLRDTPDDITDAEIIG
ncbi:HdeD family acid-resistance protein [Alistipes sp.]|uniref:HdeD family acid-resistance protein n=1 Tax=Alistipes sp. TaxID=1872444 RepID=UPI0025BDA152|nr:HdeD family acid-resistance protein [Alistipes sp.]